MTHTDEAALQTASTGRASLPQAMDRFVSGAFRLRGRANRSEYWW
ncbi:hypothetical protein [Microbacterium sp. TWP3-1-2b2]